MIRLRPFALILMLISAALLAGCSTTSHTSKQQKGGGYYKDDGPQEHPPANIDSTPDAIPRIETHSSGTSKPYVVFGKRYVPIPDDRPFTQKGRASWYGKKFHGNKTANGEIYDMNAMTAAHPTLPIPSYARVTRVSTGKSVVVRINDRGPFHSSRIIDLSYAAAARLGLIGHGSGQVVVQAITNDDIRNGEATASEEAPAKPAASVRAMTTAAPTPNALAAIPAMTTNASMTSKGTTGKTGSMALAQPATAPHPTMTLESPAATRQSGTAADQIYLQFGAFGASENADHLAGQLNSQIKQIESRSAHVDAGEKLYRVQIGPYPDRTAAVNAAVRIQEATNTHPSIVVR